MRSETAIFPVSSDKSIHAFSFSRMKANIGSGKQSVNGVEPFALTERAYFHD
jgi:hypothetical protein